MRRSFFSKAIVAVGVMASAIALSSICTFAANKTGPTTDNVNGTITTKWVFNDASANGNWKAGTDYDGITVATDDVWKPKTAGYVQANTNNNGQAYIPIAEDTNGGTITFVFQNKGTGRSIVVGADESVDLSATNTELSTTYEMLLIANSLVDDPLSFRIVQFVGIPLAPLVHKFILDDLVNVPVDATLLNQLPVQSLAEMSVARQVISLRLAQPSNIYS